VYRVYDRFLGGRGLIYGLDACKNVRMTLRLSVAQSLHSPLIWVEDQSVCRILVFWVLEAPLDL
jgi:hypothetical protein